MSFFEGLITSDQRERLWKKLFQEVENYISCVEEYPVCPKFDKKLMKDRLEKFSFEEPMSFDSLISWVTTQLKETQLHQSHPAYFGVFNPRPMTMGIVGELIAATYNPQLASTKSAAWAIEVEQHVIRYFAKKFGYDDSSHGVFTQGGTEANHTALLCALTHTFPEFAKEGVRATPQKPLIYTSKETHHSILRAARACGLGTESVVQVSVDQSLKMNVTELKHRIIKDLQEGHRPFFLVGTLGSTSTGVIDPLGELAVVAQNHGLWFHVDGAWGAVASLLPELQSELSGLELSDSVSFDPHKWLSVPFGAGMMVTKHPHILRQAFSLEISPYMPQGSYAHYNHEPFRDSLQWSRRFIGLKVFMVLACHGEKAIQNQLRHQVRMGDYLRAQLASNDWTTENQTSLPVVCFSHKSLNLDYRQLADNIEKTGKSFLTTTQLTYQNKTVLRAGVPNFRTQEKDVDLLVELLSNGL